MQDDDDDDDDEHSESVNKQYYILCIFISAKKQSLFNVASTHNSAQVIAEHFHRILNCTCGLEACSI